MYRIFGLTICTDKDMAILISERTAMNDQLDKPTNRGIIRTWISSVLDDPSTIDEVANLIDGLISEARIDYANKLELRIGMLRQWLNEDKITDPKKMITNDDIKSWLHFEELTKEDSKEGE